MVLDLQQPEGHAGAQVLDQIGKLSNSRRARSISSDQRRAPNERQHQPVDRDGVFSFHIQQAVSTEREKVDSSEGSAAAQVDVPLWRRSRARRANKSPSECETLSTEGRKRGFGANGNLSEILRVPDASRRRRSVKHLRTGRKEWLIDAYVERALDKSVQRRR